MQTTAKLQYAKAVRVLPPDVMMARGMEVNQTSIVVVIAHRVQWDRYAWPLQAVRAVCAQVAGVSDRLVTIRCRMGGRSIRTVAVNAMPALWVRSAEMPFIA